MFLHADNVSASFWKKRSDLPKIPPHVEDDDIKALASAISTFFYNKEGRGKNCVVEPYRCNNKEYFFAVFDWVQYLKNECLFGNNDPLVP